MIQSVAGIRSQGAAMFICKMPTSKITFLDENKFASSPGIPTITTLLNNALFCSHNSHIAAYRAMTEVIAQAMVCTLGILSAQPDIRGQATFLFCQ